MHYTSNTTIEEIHSIHRMSNRTYHCLTSANVKTIEELYQLFLTPEVLMDIKSFGAKSFAEVGKIVKKYKKDRKSDMDNGILETNVELIHHEEIRPLPTVEYAISTNADIVLQHNYLQMLEELSAKPRAYLEQHFPCYKDFLPYAQISIKDFVKYSPEKVSNYILSEVHRFIEKFTFFLKHILSLSEEELEKNKTKIYFPFLSEEEQDFVITRFNETYHYPYFYLLYKYILHTGRSGYIYCLANGIIGNMNYSEIALKENISHERVRQIANKNYKINNSFIEKFPECEPYSLLLKLPFITSDTEVFATIKEHEQFPMEFSAFASLLTLNDCFEKVSYDEHLIVLNKNLLQGFNFSYSNYFLVNLFSESYIEETAVSLLNVLFYVPDKTREVAAKLMRYVAKTFYNIESNDEGFLLFPQNTISIEFESIKILRAKGNPMSLDEIFAAFKEKFPEHKYTNSKQIKQYISQSKEIQAVGYSGYYGLPEWTHIYFGNISDYIFIVLSKSDVPLHIDVIYKAVLEIFPTTRIEYIKKLLEDIAFEEFENDFYGLYKVKYPKEYIYKYYRYR